MLHQKKISKFKDLHSVPRCFLQSIPALSIAAFLGIGVFALNPTHEPLTNAPDAFAEEGIMPLADTSASLTIDDGKIKDTIFATNGEFAYASHKVTISANTVKSVTLTLSRTSDLTGPSTVSGAGGKTPDQMDNAWGYAWATEGTDPTTATYQTLNASNTLTGVAPDSSHNVNTSRQLIFGAKFGSSAASGTYHAEATLSLVATPYTVVNYSISYNLNGGTSSAIAATTASDDTGAASKTLKVTSTVPTRSGYKFLGWATSSTGSVTYASGANITLQATNPTITLYAAWQQDISWSSITQMQQMTADICKGATTGASKTLTDSRDGKPYTVAKLKDGQCWMTSNLAFDITQATNAMSSANSDVVSGWSWSTTPTRYTTGTGWSASDTAVAYITTPTVDSSYTGDGSGLQSNYGYYYSWCAATAGCKDASGNNPAANVDAASSICPKGWKLPAGTPGTGTNDFAKAIGLSTTNIAASTNYWSSLSNPTFSNRLLTVNNSTWIAAGRVNPGNGLRVPGTNGYYWSRTAYSTTSAYYFVFRSGYAYPANYGTRRTGYSVRCVAYSS